MGWLMVSLSLLHFVYPAEVAQKHTSITMDLAGHQVNNFHGFLSISTTTQLFFILALLQIMA